MGAIFKVMISDQKKPIKIAIVTAIWKRPEVFKLFCKGIRQFWSKRYHDKVVVDVFIAGSEGDISRRLVQGELPVANYVEIKNDPLARKMNAALQLARGYDFALCVGSDDVIHPDLFDRYIAAAERGIDFVGVLDFYFWDTKTRKAAYWGGYREKYRQGMTCGAGRMFSARLLDQWNWKIWNDEHSRILDNSSDEKLRGINHSSEIFSLRETGLFGLDIKSPENMTPFELWDNTHFIDSEIITTKFDFLNL